MDSIYCFTLVIFLTTISTIYGASKYYDGEIRPYEFGYNIEGNQHRHETKDEKGIIMGEFGFITADGVYHVTAYATDEDGNFKILFMKNIKVGLPGEKKTTTTAAPTTTTTTSAPLQEVPREPKVYNLPPPYNTRACSSCKLPEKPKQGDTDNKAIPPSKSPDGINKNQNVNDNRKPISKNILPPRGPETPSTNIGKTISDNISSSKQPDTTLPNTGTQISKNKSPNSLDISSPVSQPVKTNKNIPPEIEAKFGDINPPPKLSYNENPQSRSFEKDPPLSSVDPSNPSELSSLNSTNRSPKAQDFNPNQSFKSLDDMRKALVGLLYKFNYTVGYHGHHEKGDIEGSKDGGYHFVGRDGLERNIKYIANEFGYQPHLKLEPVDSDRTPKEETEKEAGLKGYEFKWYNNIEET